MPSPPRAVGIGAIVLQPVEGVLVLAASVGSISKAEPNAERKVNAISVNATS